MTTSAAALDPKRRCRGVFCGAAGKNRGSLPWITPPGALRCARDMPRIRHVAPYSPPMCT